MTLLLIQIHSETNIFFVDQSDLCATLAKSGPFDFPSEKSFLLFFAHKKGLGHMFQK